MIAGCSDNQSLEEKGQEAGAAADKAIDRVGERFVTERETLDARAADPREKAQGVKQDVKEGLDKAGNAVDAAEAELKK